MSKGDFSAWIEDGEKYAILGLNVKTEGRVPSGVIAPDLTVLADMRFSVPRLWQEWLGTIRVREVEDCNLFFLSKLPSSTPGVLDGENQKLQRQIWNTYIGLLLVSTFAPAHKPVMLTGARLDGEIDVGEQQDFESPIPCIWSPYPSVFFKDIEFSARLGEHLNALTKSSRSDNHWRLLRTLSIYVDARSTADILDRLHQYCRCIDGLILPDAGKTRQQFKSKTELFIGPRHHDLMGAIYDVRSAVEHLHENRYLEGFDRAIRLDLLKKEAIAGHIARTALARVLADKNLWHHFANTPALAAFWALPAADRQQIWGTPFDPMDSISGFDPTYIHDSLLGEP